MDAVTKEILAKLPRLISHRPFEWAKKSPGRPAIVEDEVTWTYKDLAIAVEGAKALLMGLDVRPGDRVLMINENCRAFVALLLACSELEACAVSVNARLSALEIDNIRAHCQPRRTFYTAEVSPDAIAHGERHGAEIREISMLGKLSIGSLADVQEEPVFKESEKHVAAMIYTTGTTGNPKGVMLSHQNLLFISETTKDVRGFTPDDYVYLTLPLSHIFGLSSSFLSSLYAGAALHLVPGFNAAHLFKTLPKGIRFPRGSGHVFQPPGTCEDQQGGDRRTAFEVLVLRRCTHGHGPQGSCGKHPWSTAQQRLWPIGNLADHSRTATRQTAAGWGHWQRNSRRTNPLRRSDKRQ